MRAPKEDFASFPLHISPTSLKVEHPERHGLEREGGVAGQKAHPRVPHRARHRGLVSELGVAGTFVIWRRGK